MVLSLWFAVLTSSVGWREVSCVYARLEEVHNLVGGDIMSCYFEAFQEFVFS